MRRTARTAVGAAAALVLVTATAASAAPGGAGIGDPYYPTYGNGGYDVSHYAIAVDYDPPTDRVTGDTVITATATQDLSSFHLDLVLTATSVVVNGTPARFRQVPHELVVTPATTVRKGQPLTVRVRYGGIPSSISDAGLSPWLRTPDGALAVGEPEIAAWWFPANDHPRDKATYDIAVTVPKGLKALSNGLMLSRTATGDRVTWAWREANPMASYLAFMAVGRYDVRTTTTPSGIPVLTATGSGNGIEMQRARADFERVPEVIDWEAAQWGPYPFETVGSIAADVDFGFALENQTRPVYTRVFWRNSSNVYVLVHELAHQWYGDSVSVQNWRDIWLNEGFASFAEWRWSETHGEGSAQDLLSAYYGSITATSSFWRQEIGDPGKGSEFASPVYDRGAMTLQALRNRIGSPAFFQVMRQWAASHRGGNGSIPQFIGLAERLSGQDLGAFFQAWLYTPSKPAATADNGLAGVSPTVAPTVAPASLAKLRAASGLRR